MDQQILIIEAENSLRANLVLHLRQEGYQVSVTDSTDEAMALIGGGDIGLIILGLEDLRRNGISMMRMIRQSFPDIKVITINSGEHLDLSIESMRLGAYDDFLIPFDLDALLDRIRSVAVLTMK